jgi:hypothetical protein
MGWIQRYDIEDEPLPILTQIGSTEDRGISDPAVERDEVDHEDRVELATGELDG